MKHIVKKLHGAVLDFEDPKLKQYLVELNFSPLSVFLNVLSYDPSIFNWKGENQYR